MNASSPPALVNVSPPSIAAVSDRDPAMTSWSANTAIDSLRAELDEASEEYVITGHKIWTSYSDVADWCLLLARTDPDRSIGHKGLSMFIVPKERGDGHGFQLGQDKTDQEPGKDPL